MVFGGVWGGGGRLGGQGGCERRIEVFEKIHKKMVCGGWWGVRVGGGGGREERGGGEGRVGGVRGDVNEELKFLRKFTKKKRFSGCVGGGGGVGWGGQGGCERRIEVFEKIHKKWFSGAGGGFGLGGGGRVGGVRGDVNEELKFLRKFTKKRFSGVCGGGGVGWGVRVDVNEELKFLRNSQKMVFWGLGGGGGSGWVEGQGGCERRIEVFVKIQKKIWGSGWM